MQTKPLPEIGEADLKAAREFLSDGRGESLPRSTPSSRPAKSQGGVPVSNGITRARRRSSGVQRDG